eukprot:TRINITY_DN848_c0_g1_i1.p2 TRINITY_DN848_c0_g1~~TRINITY_DN848_c0_g1_i1.p2  ORF type:complete len:697 (-),score=252.50 TRINITY_DN848_c0_g1_i1:1814-3904(-)
MRGLAEGYTEKPAQYPDGKMELSTGYSFAEFIDSLFVIISFNLQLRPHATKELNSILETMLDRYPGYFKKLKILPAIETLKNITADDELIDEVTVKVKWPNGGEYEQAMPHFLWDMTNYLNEYKDFYSAGKVLGDFLRLLKTQMKEQGDKGLIAMAKTAKFTTGDAYADDAAAKLFFHFAVLAANKGNKKEDFTAAVEVVNSKNFPIADFSFYITKLRLLYSHTPTDVIKETLKNIDKVLDGLKKELGAKDLANLEPVKNFFKLADSSFDDASAVKKRLKGGAYDANSIQSYADRLYYLLQRKRFVLAGLVFGSLLTYTSNPERAMDVQNGFTWSYDYWLNDKTFNNMTDILCTRLFVGGLLTADSNYFAPENLLGIGYNVENLENAFEMESMGINFKRLKGIVDDNVDEAEEGFNRVRKIFLALNTSFTSVYFQDDVLRDQRTNDVAQKGLAVLNTFDKFFYHFKRKLTTEITQRFTDVSNMLGRKFFVSAGTATLPLMSNLHQLLQAQPATKAEKKFLEIDDENEQEKIQAKETGSIVTKKIEPANGDVAILNLILKGVFEYFMLPNPKSLEKCIANSASGLLNTLKKSIKEIKEENFLTNQVFSAVRVWEVIEAKLDDDTRECYDNALDISKLKGILKKKNRNGDSGQGMMSLSLFDYDNIVKEARTFIDDEYYEDFGKKLGELLDQILSVLH